MRFIDCLRLLVACPSCTSPQSVSVLQRLRAGQAALNVLLLRPTCPQRCALRLPSTLDAARTAYDALLADCDAIAYGRDGVDGTSNDCAPLLVIIGKAVGTSLNDGV